MLVLTSAVLGLVLGQGYCQKNTWYGVCLHIQWMEVEAEVQESSLNKL